VIGETVVIPLGCVFSGMEKTNETLVDLRLPQHLGVGKSADASDQGVGVSAGSFDQVGYTRGSELPDGRIGCKATGTAGVFRVPIQLIAGFGLVGEIGGMIGEGCAMGVAIGHESITAVEWNVQPFVAVGYPRVGAFDAREEMPEARGRGGPETERSVDMNPCAVFLCQRNESREVVEGTDVNVTGLKDDDSGCGRRGFERLTQRVFEKVALRVGLEDYDVFFAKTEQADSADKRSVFFGAGEDANCG